MLLQFTLIMVRDQARIVRLCFMAALLPRIWNIYYDMFQWRWFRRSDVIFYCFCEKYPASVTKVPAVAGSRLLFWPLSWLRNRVTFIRFFTGSSSSEFSSSWRSTIRTRSPRWGISPRGEPNKSRRNGVTCRFTSFSAFKREQHECSAKNSSKNWQPKVH